MVTIFGSMIFLRQTQCFRSRPAERVQITRRLLRSHEAYQPFEHQIFHQPGRGTQMPCKTLCCAAGNQANRPWHFGQRGIHALNGAKLGLQAAAGDGVGRIARQLAVVSACQRQLRGILRQGAAHQVAARQDQSATE